MKFKWYTDGKITIKVMSNDKPPEGFILGRTINANPWNKGLTAENDSRVKQNIENSLKTRSTRKYTAWNKGLTKELDPRLKGLSGANNPMYGKHPVAWNKGLTKETDSRVQKISASAKGRLVWNKGIHTEGHPHSEETKNKLKKIHSSLEYKTKRYNTMKANNSFWKKESKAECAFYEELKLKYNENDIIKQYFDSERYPFCCDFYIKSEDLFIELHANWTHGGHPFDPNSEEDLEKLAIWQEKAKTSKYYKNAIYQWTDLDVRKASIAKENNLNFIVIY